MSPRRSSISGWSGAAAATALRVSLAGLVVPLALAWPPAIAMVGLRLGILNTISYTIVVLVAIVTALMAPPLLRLAMNRVADTTEERQRLRLHQP